MQNNQRAMVISLIIDFLKHLLHNSKTRNQQDQPQTHSNFETTSKTRSIVHRNPSMNWFSIQEWTYFIEERGVFFLLQA